MVSAQFSCVFDFSNERPNDTCEFSHSVHLDGMYSDNERTHDAFGVLNPIVKALIWEHKSAAGP